MNIITEVGNVKYDILYRTQKNIQHNAVKNALSMIKVYDNNTLEHCLEVANISAMLQYAHQGYFTNNLLMSALLHDIGKIFVGRNIINKQGLLTKEERIIIERHPIDTYRILHDSFFFDEAICKSASQHHERLDGSGYPYGLTVSKITEDAKIIAIADVFSAIIDKRSYKDAEPSCFAFNILENPNLFDQKYVSYLRMLDNVIL